MAVNPKMDSVEVPVLEAEPASAAKQVSSS